MKKTVAILLFTVLAGTTLAQPVPSPANSEQALNARLMVAINAAEECSAKLIKAQSELSAAQARIKELEDKYERKKGAAKKK